ncbi:nucleoside deaminase [Rubripirellula amarantea]|uniref:Guanine deaminase n=1 Tax=Rubripirellula amarantea TaxID=2527999 RepID=A0A5C5WTJ5_9BACT|nr:nucleoside deaminase [Rubripirellula amarantea]MDA8744430.1 nucleoside deaminase [Rubripirellula amarantea]TWT53343.1 Guanine deaminase [Rubripirellula amarantea]
MRVSIEIPAWVLTEQTKLPTHLTSTEAQMEAVIHFSRLNFQNQTGGPFAAGVFEKETGKLIAIGVNRVVPEHVSSAHAEIVALSLAQQSLETFDLGGPGMPHHRLVVNGRPCAMCFGSLPWSGIRSLVIGASGEQIETITGFDEGPIHPRWQDELQSRGIDVIEDVLADQACDMFREFAASGAKVYNGRSGSDD